MSQDNEHLPDIVEADDEGDSSSVHSHANDSLVVGGGLSSRAVGDDLADDPSITNLRRDSIKGNGLIADNSQIEKRSDRRRPLCRFFLMGTCKYGEHCTCRHDLAPEEGCSIEEARRNVICPFFVKGKCRHRERCWFSHDLTNKEKHLDEADNVVQDRDGRDENVSGLTVVEPSTVSELKTIKSPQQQQQQQTKLHRPPLQQHQSRQERKSISSIPKIDDDDGFVNCGICLENVVEKGRRFALFSNCIHPFCYECARSWHRDNHYRTSLKSNGFDVESQLIYHSCPVCRIDSEFIFPSRDYKTGHEKDAFIARYKQERLGRPCKFFKGEIGTCPFGKECFYAHLSPEGKDLKPFDVKKPKGKSSMEQLKTIQDHEELLNENNMYLSWVQGGLRDEPDFFDIIETQEEAMVPTGTTLIHGNASFPVDTDQTGHTMLEDNRDGHYIRTTFQPEAISNDNFTIPNVTELDYMQDESSNLKENVSTWWGNTITQENTVVGATAAVLNYEGYGHVPMLPLGNINTANLLLSSSSSWGCKMRPEHDQKEEAESLTGRLDLTWLPSLHAVSATNSEATLVSNDHDPLSFGTSANDRFDEDTHTSLILDLQKFME